MDIAHILAFIIAIVNALVAILAWFAKIRWSNEFARAKDETIKAKEAMVEVKDAQLQAMIMEKDEVIRAKDEQIKMLEREVHSLQELTPMKIREYFLSVRQQIEEYNDLLKGELEEANREIEKKNDEIALLQTMDTQKTKDIQELEEERDRISSAASSLEIEIENLWDKYESDDVIVWKMPGIDKSTFIRTDAIYKELSGTLTKGVSKEYSDLFKSLSESFLVARPTDDIMKSILSRFTSEPPQTPEKNNTIAKEENEDTTSNTDDEDSGEAN
jgi:hypothetical protein